jgi:hypothetical protein
MKKLLIFLLIFVSTQVVSQTRYFTTSKYVYDWNDYTKEYDNYKEFDDNSVFTFSSDYSILTLSGYSNMTWVITGSKIEDDILFIECVDNQLNETLVLIDNAKEIKIVFTLDGKTTLVEFPITKIKEY